MTIRNWRLRASAIVLGAALLVGAVRGGTAHAANVGLFHVTLSKAEPGMNDTVTTSPEVIKMWFSEPVQAAVTGARLTAPDGHRIPLGAVIVDRAPKAPAVVTVKEKLASGKYTLAWKTMANDGHPASGAFMFVVRLAKP